MKRQLSKAIIVIFAAALIAVSIYIGVLVKNAFEREKSKHTEARMQYNWYLLALHHARTGAYPDPGRIGTIPDITIEVRGKMLKLAAFDGWNSPFLYVCSADGSTYHMVSYGGSGAIEDPLPPESVRSSECTSNVVFNANGVVNCYRGWAFHHPWRDNFTEEQLLEHIPDWVLKLPSSAVMPSEVTP